MQRPLSPATFTPGNGQSGKTKLISCTTCQQRKVKCDKAQPTCSNCAKHRTRCIYVAPALPLRKKKKSPEGDLECRLRRYEHLLRAHGIQVNKGLDHASTSKGSNSVLDAPNPYVIIESVSPI